MLKKCLNVESKPDNAQSRVFFSLQDQNPQCLLVYLGFLFCFSVLQC